MCKLVWKYFNNNKKRGKIIHIKPFIFNTCNSKELFYWLRNDIKGQTKINNMEIY